MAACLSAARWRFFDNETKWKQTIIKSFRLSPALLDMVETECRVQRTQFSKFVRYAVIPTPEARTPSIDWALKLSDKLSPN
jgi:hypothetical protein